MALLILLDKVINSLEKGEFVLGVLLDLSKAFDTVNHDIMISKLEYYGIRGIALEWFKNYLTDRKQRVLYNKILSSETVISCGVPKGSILGRLMFLLYVNDLANVSENLFTIMFADDTNVFVSGNNEDSICTIMNENLKLLYDWLNANKLSLNVKKTNYMLFRPRLKICKSDLPVKINSQYVSKTEKNQISWSCPGCKIIMEGTCSICFK